MGIDPLYYWLQGSYYLLIMLGGYFPVVILGLFGIHSVLLEQFFIKFPLIIFLFLTALVTKEIVYNVSENRKYADISSLLFLTNPVSFYVVGIHGNPMIIPVFFTLLSIKLIDQKKMLLAGLSLGIAIGTYLYPIFFLLPFTYYLIKKKKMKDVFLFIISSFAFAFLGIFLPYIVFILQFHYLPTSGLIHQAMNESYMPYYSVFTLLELIGNPSLIPHNMYLWIFIISMLFFSFLTIIILKWNMSIYGLNTAVLILSITFTVFSLETTPQYFFAFVPFLIIYSILKRKEWLLTYSIMIGLLLFLALFTWGSGDLFGFFANTYPLLLSYRQYFPGLVRLLFSFLVGTSAFLLLLILTTFETKSAIFLNIFYSKHKKNIIKEQEKNSNISSEALRIQIITILIIVIFGFTAVSPALSNPPRTMELINYINTFDMQPSVKQQKNGSSLVLNYTLPYIVKLLPDYVKNNVMVNISYNDTPQIIFESFYQTNNIGINTGESVTFNFLLPYKTRNLSFTFMSYYLSFSNGNFSLVPQGINHNSRNPVYGTCNYFVLNQYNIVGAAFINVTFPGPFDPGQYTMAIHSIRSTLFLAVNNYSSPGLAIYVNGKKVSNQYISTIIYGIPLLFYNVTVGSINIRSENTTISVPLSSIAGNDVVVIHNISLNTSIRLPLISQSFCLSNWDYYSYVFYNEAELLIGAIAFMSISLFPFIFYNRIKKRNT
jgi:hypothetical protein